MVTKYRDSNSDYNHYNFYNYGLYNDCSHYNNMCNENDC